MRSDTFLSCLDWNRALWWWNVSYRRGYPCGGRLGGAVAGQHLDLIRGRLYRTPRDTHTKACKHRT